MISLEQINAEIASLEEEKPSYQVMDRLASMYVVRDHMVGTGNHSVDAAHKAHIGSNSEFAKCIDGKCVENILELFDELMTALAAVNPRLYECVMRKI